MFVMMVLEMKSNSMKLVISGASDNLVSGSPDRLDCELNDLITWTDELEIAS